MLRDTPPSLSRVNFYITKNGVEKLSVFSNTHYTSHEYDTVSGTAVLVLNKADDVLVKVRDSDNFITGGGSSYFSGFLLR